MEYNFNNHKEAQDDGTGPPEYGGHLSESELVDAIQTYAKWCIDHYDALGEIDLQDVEIEISHQMKRAAGKAGGRRVADGLTDLRMRFAWEAYQKWGWGEDWTGVIRHELVHILQYQRRGDGGHGWDFKRLAGEVDAPKHCPQFTEYEYELYCQNCGDFAAGRHKRSKVVKQAEAYRSKCCNAPLEVGRPEG